MFITRQETTNYGVTNSSTGDWTPTESYPSYGYTLHVGDVQYIADMGDCSPRFFVPPVVAEKLMGIGAHVPAHDPQGQEQLNREDNLREWARKGVAVQQVVLDSIERKRGWRTCQVPEGLRKQLTAQVEPGM